MSVLKEKEEEWNKIEASVSKAVTSVIDKNEKAEEPLREGGGETDSQDDNRMEEESGDGLLRKEDSTQRSASIHNLKALLDNRGPFHKKS